MSQDASEAPVTQPGGLEADPGTSTGANPTIDDSYPRHDTYFFRDGNITFLVRKVLQPSYAHGLATVFHTGRWYAVLRPPILFLPRLGLFLYEIYPVRRP
jgi:hypothetical protein